MKVTIACQKKQEEMLQEQARINKEKVATLERAHQTAMETVRSEMERKIRKEMSDALQEKEKQMKLTLEEMKTQHNTSMTNFVILNWYC